ncbi:Hsp20 family protein [Amphritea pacifica]|uniref:Hsp20 family protein n=1 Tax=Amphritea pacifica TaxID=2811233 RepID=A0ABS2WBM6_9GAMM|nr:Hsp20 family protein [Amphritea pacifica]MBN0989094.1 Hsp20 family protein [Amphritea pacifica]MBN1008876.1 Hsp20 family protein [Amphritea pacifica]
MRQFDLAPLYRSAIGFDRLASMIDNATRNEQAQNGYPPYNIELISEHAYRITMAIAGFDKSEVSINTEQGMLTVTGSKKSEETERQYLHQGIAARGFERKFQLADHVRVTEASMENGLLHVDLVQEIPEAMKPRAITIN